MGGYKEAYFDILIYDFGERRPFASIDARHVDDGLCVGEGDSV